MDAGHAPSGDQVLAGGRVVIPGAVLDPGWVRLAGTVIQALGPGEPPGQPGVPVTNLQGRWVLPGFVDMHVHGGGGFSFTEGTGADARRAAGFHRAHGSTAIVASLVTAPVAELQARAAMLAGLAAEGVIDGIHAEGPFLSPARCGAQDPRHMIAPDVAVFERLLAASAGYLKVMTIAPELPGAIEVIRAATRAGVIAAVGHTDASAAVTLAAIDAGAAHATHLFNGMRPLHHREAGPVGALLIRDEVTCEVIADGVHLDDTTTRLAARTAGTGRLVLVTDAMAAAGMTDGRYELGSMHVTVAGGVARLAGDSAGDRPGAIAGSTATMADVVRHAVTAGLPVRDAVAAASTTPARVLGLAERTGALRAGLQADLVICDDDFQPCATMRQGQWVSSPGLPCAPSQSASRPRN